MRSIRAFGHSAVVLLGLGATFGSGAVMAAERGDTHRILFTVTEENAIARADACIHRLIFVNGHYLRADLTDPRCLGPKEYKRRTDLPLSAFDRGVVAATQ